MPVLRPAVMTVARKPRDPPRMLRLGPVKVEDWPKNGAGRETATPEVAAEQAGLREKVDLLAAVYDLAFKVVVLVSLVAVW